VGRALIFLAVVLAGATARAQGDPRALVDAWLAAQNQGDFAAYQALYAPQFVGIRRSGAKVVELDRAGWLKDRERMFKKPMVVKAKDLRVDDLRVQFVQTWQSGTYKDTGRKQLMLVKVGSDLRIAREELLESVGAQLDALQLEAVKALYPRGAERLLAVQVAARRNGKEKVALLVFGEPASGDAPAVPETFEIAVMGEGATARARWDFDIPLEEGIELTGVKTYTPGFDLEPDAFPKKPGDNGIGLDINLTVHENGPSDGSVTRSFYMMFRVVDGKLRRVLSLQVLEDTGDAECGSGTSSSVTVNDAGDIVEERTVHTSTFTGRDCKNRYKKSTRVWKWNGTRFAR